MKEFLYNDNIMDEIVFPRNEKEMCELFEDLLFMRMEYHDKKEKETAEFMNLDDTALVLERLWFAPPTCFRLLPVTQQYL